MLGKIQILFIALYFLPFYYSVMPSEKCVLCRAADEVLLLPIHSVLKNKMTTNQELEEVWLLYNTECADINESSK